MTQANEESIKNGLKNGLKKAGIELKDGTLTLNTSALSKVTDDLVNAAVGVFNNYQSKINTRLIGYIEDSTNAFKQIIDRNAKTSPFYRTTDYLANVDKLVQEGIVQNVEQRAFLETVKDELISTFDATNDTLERLVRIQNQDSTAARAGMEAYLNAFLNKTFENSEYITDAFDTTSGLLSEATALLSAEQATSLEYVVQKWLGALYSEGMSLQGVSSLAQAVGQLASGNINDLVGSNIGNLIAMASKGNLATYFKDGLTEASADILMQSIVQYLQQLNDSSNNVVRSQLASVFGLSISDLRAASNLSTASVMGGNLSYSNAEAYTGRLLGSAGARMSTAEMMDNIYKNLMFNMGSNIAGNPFLYGAYKMGDILDKLFDDTSLSLELFGTGIQTSLSDIFKMGALGGSVLDFIHQVMGSATLGVGSTLKDVYESFGTSLAKGSTTISTGEGFKGTGTSEAGYFGNNSISDMFDTTLSGVRNAITGNYKTLTGKENTEDSIDIVVPNIYKYLINTFDGKLDTLVKLSAINNSYKVVDQVGTDITNSMKTIMGGNSVTVQATAAETTKDLTKTISENVINIYEILQKLTTGELQMSVRDTTFANAGSSVNYNGYVWTGATR